MATAAFAPSFGLLLLLIFGGGGPTGLPLSLPPLPEDPVISRVAPEDCLWYLSLSGMAKADAKNANQTEQMLAEDELQRFVTEVQTQIVAAIQKGAPQNPRDQLLATEGPKLVKTLLTRPLAMYVSKVDPMGPKGPKIEGGAIINTGEDTAAVSASLTKLETAMLGGGAAADAKWHKLPTPPDAPTVEWGFRGTYLIIGIGEGSADTIAGRGKATVPTWLVDLKKRLPVDRVATVHYLNVKKVMDIALPLAPDPKIATAIEALGLKDVQYFAAISGMQGEGCVEKTLLATSGKPTGIFAAIQGKPLTAADLAPIPQNANLAIAARVDANKLFHDATEIARKIDPDSLKQFEQGMSMLEPQFGKMPDAVLAPLGDTWCVFNSPSDGGLLFSGLTAVVPVRDQKKLLEVNDKLVAMARAMTPPAPPMGGRRQRGVTIKDVEFNKQKIFFMNFIGADSPVAPAWCITDKELIVGLFPQSVKSYLSRPAGSPSLAKVPAVAKALADEHLMAITYQDSENVFRTVYPLLQVFAQMGASEMQREGVDVDISMLPSAEAIGKHLRPAVTTVSQGKDGIQIVSQTTVPVNLSMSWIFTGAMFGVRSSKVASFSSVSANEMQSLNNMKQMALAMHMTLADTRKFPAAYSVSKDGKPLLSWRVHILPYIEQQDLYNQFHLGEPWDSEHNKALIEKMPKIYAAEGASGPGKTCYVVPRGDKTMFAGDKAISPEQISDGTSNTVMILEVDSDKAVTWTQPEDWQQDEKNLLAGLGHLRSGHFLVAMADGSARTISMAISGETAKAIFTRAGGETVNLDVLEAGDHAFEIRTEATEVKVDPGVQPVAPRELAPLGPREAAPPRAVPAPAPRPIAPPVPPAGSPPKR